MIKDSLLPQRGTGRTACFFLVFLVAVSSNSFSHITNRWTQKDIEHLTISLQDRIRVEFLQFAPKGKVAVKWGTKDLWTNPWLDWKFSNGRISIYEEGRVAEELTLLKREGSFLIIRMQSGKIGRFKVIREKT
jgi:hypothetical protein